MRTALHAHVGILTGLMVVLVRTTTAEDGYYPPADTPEPPPPPSPTRGYGLPAPSADFRYTSHHTSGDYGTRYTSAASSPFRNSGNTADGDGYVVEAIPTSGGSSGGFGGPAGIGGPGVFGGPAGFGGPPPGPIPPIPPPPPVNPLTPPGPCSPAGYIWMRLYTLVEPITVLVIGVSIFVVVKHLIIPYMLYIARTTMFLDLDKEDRSLLHPATARVVEAATKGLCLERITCHLGKAAQGYILTGAVLSAIEDSEQVPKLFAVFRDAASGQQESCEPYSCFKKSPSTAQAKKQSHWKRKPNT